MDDTDNNLPDLTPKQSLFVSCYFANGMKGREAAIESGYSARSAHVRSTELLNNPKVKAHIDYRCKRQQTDNILTVDKIIQQLSDMAQVDPLELYNEDGSLKPLSQMPKSARLCISEITPTQNGMKIKLEGRQKAVELMGRYMKMFTDRVDVTTGGESLNAAPNEEAVANARDKILANLKPDSE